jgi:hypothetical protein
VPNLLEIRYQYKFITPNFRLGTAIITDKRPTMNSPTSAPTQPTKLLDQVSAKLMPLYTSFIIYKQWLALKSVMAIELRYDKAALPSLEVHVSRPA